MKSLSYTLHLVTTILFAEAHAELVVYSLHIVLEAILKHGLLGPVGAPVLEKRLT